jgi:hypothetical protein
MQLAVKFLFTCVPEGRMPDIVGEGHCLSERFVQSERRSHSSGNLRDLDRVRKAIPPMVRVRPSENLRLVF